MTPAQIWSLVKFLIPIVLVASIYFYGHDKGWNDRDAEIPALTKSAVDSAVGLERTACAAGEKLTGGINEKIAHDKADTAARLADALGKLWDEKHSRGGSPSIGTAAGRDNGAAGDPRLYYADPAAARAVLARDGIATDQAHELVGCQAYIAGVTKNPATLP